MTASAVESAPEQDVSLFGRAVEYKWLVTGVVVCALFLDIMDTTIVNVALPTLGRNFGAHNIEWIVIGYTLSLAVFIPTAGWLSDRIGTKRVFLFAFAIFIFCSALCGAAHSLAQLVTFRIMQGAGGGMLTPVGMATLFRVFPPAERARASTMLMIPTLAAPTLGPVVGGVLITNLSWRWVFYINLPIGITAFTLAWRKLREHREPSAGSFDIAGFVLSAGGLATIVYALSEGPLIGWTKGRVLGCGLGGAACLALMVYVETHKTAPMLQLHLLRNRMFRKANIVSAFSIASFLGLLYVLPQYLQSLRGLSAEASGLTTFPQAIGVGCSTIIAGRWYKRIGPRRLIATGLFFASITIYAFHWLTVDTNLWWIRGLMLLRGFSMGFAFVPMQASSYATIAPADNGRAASIFSTQRQVAISIVVAVLATILDRYLTFDARGLVNDPARGMDGFHITFFVSASVAFVGSMFALTIKDSDAAGTMSPR